MELDGIELYRGTTKTLSVDHLEIKAGSLTAVVGVSGSGKTTFMECLSGILRPQTGQVSVDGHHISENLQQHQQDLAYVPQDDIVHEEVTVEKAVEFASILRLGDKALTDDHRQRINRLLERLRIDDVRSARVGRLSGGQQKRVSTATELVSNPRLLLLDEPTAGLDPGNHQSFMEMLREVADSGCTVVVTTHRTSMLDQCDSMILIDEGTVGVQGSPEQVLNQTGCETFNDLFLRTLSNRSSERAEEPSSSYFQSMMAPFFPIYLIVKGILFWSFVLIRDFLRVLYVALRATLTRPIRSFGFTLRHLIPRLFALLRREQMVLFQHPAFLSYLMLLPLGIGILIGVVSVRHTDPARTMFLSLVASFWLGINTSALSIIRELSIVSKERMASPYQETYVVSYLSSKLIWYGLLGIIAGMLMVGGLFLTGSIHYAPYGYSFRIIMSIVLIELAVFIGVLIGLMVSTVSENQVFAMALTPLIVLPGLLLSRVTLNKTPYEPVGTPEVRHVDRTQEDGDEEEKHGEEAPPERDDLLPAVWYWAYRVHPVSFLYDGTPLTLRLSPENAEKMKQSYLRETGLKTLLPSVILGFFLYFLTHLVLLFRGRIGTTWF